MVAERTQTAGRSRPAARQFPGLRWLRTSLRTGHIAAFSGLVGGHVFDASASALQPWLFATIATGGALIALNLYQTSIWLRELRGIAIMVKMALLCIIPVWWDARLVILFVVIAISGYVSHMPGRYRYWVIGEGPPQGKQRHKRG